MQFDGRIGAWLTQTGCTFRVWAPHAIKVSVLIQSGPYWEIDDAIIEQVLEKNGAYWTTIVSNVSAWQLYRYKIEGPDETIIERLDPAARDVLSSDLTRQDPSSRNGSVVQGMDPFPWSEFKTPWFEDFIIYELHIGSFCGRGEQPTKTWSTFQDVEVKLSYIQEMGFNWIEIMPVHEFAQDRSWGYNPSTFFAPESSYGSPFNLMHFVDTAHRHGLAVIIDVVYNHAGSGDNSLYEYDGYTHEGGIYFEQGQQTDWGRGPAWYKREVKNFFYQNAKMFFEDYRVDGLRFDVTTQINGNDLSVVINQLRSDFPDKYFVAEHLPDNPWIIRTGRFCATWQSNVHHECQRALAGQDALTKVKGILGWDGYDHSWNLVKYILGSHDDIGDLENGNAEKGLTNWDKRHRYFIDQVGGRQDWTARAKCRLAWALNVAMPGTPMLFMGSECHMASPYVSWGYWHDGLDDHGDHRFNWDIAGDPIGMQMRRLVTAANACRWQNPALRADSLSITHEDPTNQVLSFLRQTGTNTILTIVNLSDQNFTDHRYGVKTGSNTGQWTQLLCTQDRDYGGWDGAGNAYFDPWTQADGKIYINLPKWSILVFKKRA